MTINVQNQVLAAFAALLSATIMISASIGPAAQNATSLMI